VPIKVKGTIEFDGEKIPGHWIDDPASPDQKRFVATKHGYRKLRIAKCHAALQRCTLQGPGCRIKAPFHAGELHHTGPHGRGSGGSWRDDRHTVWTCRPCHDREEMKRNGLKWHPAHVETPRGIEIGPIRSHGTPEAEKERISHEYETETQP